MRYGEAFEDEELGIGMTDEAARTIFVAKGISVALFRTDVAHSEVFPPSTGTLTIIGSKVVCKKERVTRVRAALPVPSGPPAMVDQVVVEEPGVQWFIFDLEEVTGTGRTMLLNHKVTIEDDEEGYEVVMDRGSRSRRFVSFLNKQAREN
jgi:hypothetical protein